jgi:hypothetical protein
MTFVAGLLAGRRIALTGGGLAVIGEQLDRLGAWAGHPPADEELLSAWVADSLPLHALVHCTSAADSAAGS